MQQTHGWVTTSRSEVGLRKTFYWKFVSICCPVATWNICWTSLRIFQKLIRVSKFWINLYEIVWIKNIQTDVRYCSSRMFNILVCSGFYAQPYGEFVPQVIELNVNNFKKANTLIPMDVYRISSKAIYFSICGGGIMKDRAC